MCLLFGILSDASLAGLKKLTGNADVDDENEGIVRDSFCSSCNRVSTGCFK